MVSAVCMGGSRLVPRLARPMQDTVQRAQPEGVPPLELTGERTLPDVPAENYWFRRHLAVYEWVAERCAGPRRGRHGLRRGLRGRTCWRAARAGSPAWTPTPRPTSTRGSSTRARASASCATWWRTTPSPATPSSSSRRSSTWPTRGGAASLPRAAAAGRDRLRVHAQPAHARARPGPRSRTTPGT